MVARVMNENTYGTGKPGKGTGMTTEYRIAKPFEFRSPGTVQQQQRNKLHYTPVCRYGKFLKHRIPWYQLQPPWPRIAYFQVGQERLPRG